MDHSISLLIQSPSLLWTSPNHLSLASPMLCPTLPLIDSFLFLLSLSTFISVTPSSASGLLLSVSVSKPHNTRTLSRFECPLQDRPPPLSVLLHLLPAFTIHHNVMQTSRSIEIPFLLYLSALFITIATKWCSNLILGAVSSLLWAPLSNLQPTSQLTAPIHVQDPSNIILCHSRPPPTVPPFLSLNTCDLFRSTKTWWGSLWPTLFFYISNLNWKYSIFYSFGMKLSSNMLLLTL